MKDLDNIAATIEKLDSEETCSEAILSVRAIFENILHKRSMLRQEDCQVSDHVNTMTNHYNEAWLKLLQHPSQPAIETLWNFLQQEGKYPMVRPKKGHYYFPCDRLKMIMKRCFSLQSHFESLAHQLDEYTNHIDVVYYFWLIAPKILAKLNNPSEKQISRILTVIQRVPVPSEEELHDLQEDVLLCFTKSKPKFKPKYSSLQESVGEIWSIVSRWKLTSITHKKILILLIESFMNHLKKPTLLMDFLMESLNAGGSVSVLSLQGIFTLVKDHNLDHPNIYDKLYSFFHSSMFYAKYKSRLYVLTNIFLSSTHLPETLIASFIKRFARLCLHAPPHDIVVLSTFIGNLLIRHPSLKIMIQHQVEKTVETDPFLENETDPLKTNAIESSLWELETLQQHVLPKVSKTVSFIHKPLPTVEWDLTELFEDTFDQMYGKASSQKLQKVSLTFEKPASLALPRTSYFSDLWNQ